MCTLVNPAFATAGCAAPAFVDFPGGTAVYYAPVKAIGAQLAHLLPDAHVDALRAADYLDVSYSNATRALVIHAFTGARAGGGGAATARAGAELGVLGHSAPMDAESFTLGGVVHAAGRDARPEPVLFTFPARHYRHGGAFAASIAARAGLHPRVRIALAAAPRPAAACALHAYFALPRALFVDQYQLSAANPQLRAALGVRAVRAVAGETDLEAPVWAAPRWGSGVVVQLDEGRDVVEVPLHLRYLPPGSGAYEQVPLPAPAVFWACDAQGDAEWAKSPFAGREVPWDGWFDERTVYWDLTPKIGWLEVRVPVLEAERAALVRWGTVGVVAAGMTWICWKIGKAVVKASKTDGEKKVQ